MHRDIDILELRDHYFRSLEEKRAELEEVLEAVYFPNIVDKVNKQKNMDDHLYGRSQFFFNTVLPWMNDFFDLSATSFIEIGPGTGASTAPLGLTVQSVHAYDISDKSANVGRFRCEALNLSNVHINISDPNELLHDLRANHRSHKVGAALLYAVLEHMPLKERLATIRAVWEVIADDGYLVVGDTPNRLTYSHGHTSRTPFFDMVPDELMLPLLDEMGNQGFAEALRGWIADGMAPEEMELRIDRWGRGISYHEFLATLGPVAAYTLGEGLERRMVRAIPISKEEKLLMEYLNHRYPEIPLGFGRQSLYLIFQKNETAKANLKRFDEDLLRGLLKA